MLQRLGDESSSPSSDRDVDSSVSDRGQNVLPSHFRNLQSNWGRCLVAAVLLISAAVLGTVTFLLIRSDEVDDFNKEFEVASAEVVDGSRRNYETLLTGIHTFATLFPSVAGELNETLPYLALRDYEAFGFGARQLTGALCFIYVPLLTTVGMQDRWEIYASANQGWIANGRSFYPDADEPIQESNPIIPYIHNLRDFEPDRSPGPKAPIWQSSPPPVDTDFINYNMYDNEAYAEIVNYTALTGTPVLSTPFPLREITNRFLSLDIPEMDGPLSLLLQPVYSEINPRNGSELIAHVMAVVSWKTLFENLLDQGKDEIDVVVTSCQDSHTFTLIGTNVVYVGAGDLHTLDFGDKAVSTPFASGQAGTSTFLCPHSIKVYPSRVMQKASVTNSPWIYTGVVVIIFVFSLFVFCFHDWQMRRRQNRAVSRADRSDAIVKNLFPDTVRDKLFGRSQESKKGDGRNESEASPGASSKYSLVSQEPTYVAIAELFPEATVMFANIAGFTAWSSLREPAQVFMLLESIFQSFDEAAQKLKIFKVETVGDCYLAVCGVPQYNKDHAIIMARFARACQHRSQQVFHSLGNTLGPDTVELGMRFGVHSGPVTAGVLRGDRARFQLFGDTVNTASRIESAGEINQIHISEQTASLLRFAGKFSWIRLREDRVEAKGKEFLETFWLKTKSCSYAPPETALSSTRNEEDHLSIENTARSIRSTPSTVSTDYISMEMGSRLRDKSTQRLVDWNCELLQQFLRQVVARRHAVGTRRTSAATLDLMAKKAGNESNAVHQVADIITMPNFDERAFRLSNEPLELEPVVVEQLRNFVDVVCSMYHDNPFHNFEHASHVAMSVTKLLSRIVAPTFSGANIRNSTILGIISSDGSVIGSDELEATQGQDRSKPDHARTANTQQLFQDQAQLHDHTYGITSDPLTQFAVVLSALVHDVDHRGVPNFLLVKENEALASVYHNKSVAEQNSIDLAWNTLLAPEFDALRACIYSDLSELRRFRQTLVNSVIATDIFDKDLSTARKARWIKAFHTLRSDGSQTNEEKQEKLSDEDPSRERNRKATIVIEHLIQASDVAHTMQHWHVYQKWNAKLFEEMYNAFLLGRSDQDPSLNWYNGEIGFFDNYIIPLAKNLKDCGVFGVSSDEYLNYALQNRREWELKGRELVSSLVDRCANNR